MTALIEFLRARLDEDEAAARGSYCDGQYWVTEEEAVYRWADDEPVYIANRKADARHIARHDPAHTIREVAAKRKILAEHKAVTRLSELTGQELGFHREWVLKTSPPLGATTRTTGRSGLCDGRG